MAAPAFDWAGAYGGVGGAVIFREEFYWANFDGHIGYNFVSGDLLIGAEVQTGAYYDWGFGWFGGVTARVGFVFDNVVAYAKFGVLPDLPDPLETYYWAILGGVEVAVGQVMSIFFEAGVEVDQDWDGFQYSIGGGGLNFHFGN
jgi:hypothetical protein